MCELRCYQYASLEERWQWPLPLQCLWALLQDEWTEPAFDQAQKTTGQYFLPYGVKQEYAKFLACNNRAQQGEREPLVPTARPPPRLFGEETRMENRCATPVAFTTNCTV